MIFERWKTKIKQECGRKIRQSDLESRSFLHVNPRNTAYHRHFEGYSEYPVLNEQGRTVKILRIYTGRLYIQPFSRKRRIVQKLLYVFLLAAAFILFGGAVVMDVPCNYNWYVTAAGAIVFFGFLWLILALVNYLPTNGELKISEYRSGAKALRYATLLCAFATALTGLLAMLAIFSNRFVLMVGMQPIYILKVICAAALFFLVNRLESHITYDIRDSEVQAPKSAVEIS